MVCFEKKFHISNKKTNNSVFWLLFEQNWTVENTVHCSSAWTKWKSLKQSGKMCQTWQMMKKNFAHKKSMEYLSLYSAVYMKLPQKFFEALMLFYFFERLVAKILNPRPYSKISKLSKNKNSKSWKIEDKNSVKNTKCLSYYSKIV